MSVVHDSAAPVAHSVTALDTRNCVHPSVSSRDLIFTPACPQGDDAPEGVQTPPVDPNHDQGIASRDAPFQAVPAVALVRVGVSRDAELKGSMPATPSCMRRLVRI